MPLQFEAKKVALKQDKSGFVLTLALHPDDAPDELLRDWVGARYMCVMVRLGDNEEPKTYANRVSKAGMLCRDYYFQKFMSDAYLADALTEEAAAAALCEKCGIESRTELNGNDLAKAIFDELVREYESWKFKGDDF